MLHTVVLLGTFSAFSVKNRAAATQVKAVLAGDMANDLVHIAAVKVNDPAAAGALKMKMLSAVVVMGFINIARHSSVVSDVF